MFHALMARFQLELFIFITPTVKYLSQETEETTRPVKNFALTTKGLQERKHN